jgi:hypothetical protein
MTMNRWAGLMSELKLRPLRITLVGGRHQKKRKEDGHDISCPHKSATVPDQAGAGGALRSRKRRQAAALQKRPLRRAGRSLDCPN